MVNLPTHVKLVNALDTNLDQSTHISVGILNDLLADCTPEVISILTEVLKIPKMRLDQKNNFLFK